MSFLIFNLINFLFNVAKEEEIKKKYDEWKKGIVQVQQHEEKIKDYLHELNKPVARHADDKDLEALLKKQEREGLNAN